RDAIRLLAARYSLIPNEPRSTFSGSKGFQTRESPTHQGARQEANLLEKEGSEAHGDSWPKPLSYMIATERAKGPSSSADSIISRAPLVLTVRQAVLEMLATTSPSFKSRDALTDTASFWSSTRSRASLQSTPFAFIHFLNAINLLVTIESERVIDLENIAMNNLEAMIFEVSLSYCLMALPERNINNVRIEQRDSDGVISHLTYRQHYLTYSYQPCSSSGLRVTAPLASPSVQSDFLGSFGSEQTRSSGLKRFRRSSLTFRLPHLPLLFSPNPFQRIPSPLAALIKPLLELIQWILFTFLSICLFINLFFLAYVSIKIDKLPSDNHPDGTQRKLFNLQRPQDQQEDRRILRDCKSNVQINRQGTDSYVMFFNEVGPRLGQSEANSFMGSEVHGKRAFLIGLVLLLIDEHLITNNPCSLQLLRGLACDEDGNKMINEYVVDQVAPSDTAMSDLREPKMRPNKELVKLRTSKKTKKRTNTKDRVKFRIHKQVTDLFSALDVVKQITSITIEPGIEDKFNTSES
ncbi:LOW QUALITY PROTEIN: hypothetical protein HID58_082378, partial [Brassica napus]